MQTIKVSTIEEVLEHLRRQIVAALRAGGFQPPPEADIPGKCEQAVRAWVRLQHRGVPRGSRVVRESHEIRQRGLEPPTQSALAAIRSEFEQGDDLTHRLTRQFYKAEFNDFLFNTFGIQHIHLGTPRAGQDTTKKHSMSGGGRALLFVLIGPRDGYFIDVVDHDVFNDPKMAKSLVQIVLRNWPDLLKPYMNPGVVSSDMSFEDAFRFAKAGFTTPFEVDGVVLVGGTVLDGKVTHDKRASCTSIEVVVATNRILNGVVRVVDFVTREVYALAEVAESRMGARPSEFNLEVVRAGNILVVREQNTGMEVFDDGHDCGLLPFQGSSSKV
jgi:hypothetical protein